MFTGEYEMPEFDLGNTFNYGEMAGLIAPRPFMVERGHDDGVAPDEWVAHEFAVVRPTLRSVGVSLIEQKLNSLMADTRLILIGRSSSCIRHLNWPEPSSP